LAPGVAPAVGVVVVVAVAATVAVAAEPEEELLQGGLGAAVAVEPAHALLLSLKVDKALRHEEGTALGEKLSI
jgi:hypothetical protein